MTSTCPIMAPAHTPAPLPFGRRPRACKIAMNWLPYQSPLPEGRRRSALADGGRVVAKGRGQDDVRRILGREGADTGRSALCAGRRERAVRGVHRTVPTHLSASARLPRGPPRRLPHGRQRHAGCDHSQGQPHPVEGRRLQSENESRLGGRAARDHRRAGGAPHYRRASALGLGADRAWGRWAARCERS